MRKPTLLILALLVGFLVSEFVIARCIQYPNYGVEHKVAYRIGGGKWTNVRKPYARLYNVEGKTLTWVNNHGLPGQDVDSLDSLIVVLGSSFVEAFQHKPNEIASSLFSSKLDSLSFGYNVLNLGCSGHDPYDSWFRLKYYEDKLSFRTNHVILVINSDNNSWFSRHPKPFTFERTADFGKVNESTSVKALIYARNMSSMLELFVKALKDTDIEEPAKHVDTVDESSEEVINEPNAPSFSEEMASCLRAFSDEYPQFKVVSTSGDDDFNKELKVFCENNGIDLSIQSLDSPTYQIGGAGHLNREGNRALADALLSVFVSQESDQ